MATLDDTSNHSWRQALSDVEVDAVGVQGGRKWATSGEKTHKNKQRPQNDVSVAVFLGQNPALFGWINYKNIILQVAFQLKDFKTRNSYVLYNSTKMVKDFIQIWTKFNVETWGEQTRKKPSFFKGGNQGTPNSLINSSFQYSEFGKKPVRFQIVGCSCFHGIICWDELRSLSYCHPWWWPISTPATPLSAHVCFATEPGDTWKGTNQELFWDKLIAFDK